MDKTQQETPPEVRLISAQVPTALADELMARASENDRSASAELRQALRSHLAKPESEAA